MGGSAARAVLPAMRSVDVSKEMASKKVGGRRELASIFVDDQSGSESTHRWKSSSSFDRVSLDVLVRLSTRSVFSE